MDDSNFTYTKWENLGKGQIRKQRLSPIHKSFLLESRRGYERKSVDMSDYEELKTGVFSMVNRGIIGNGSDMTSLITKPYFDPSGRTHVRVTKALMHPSQNKKDTIKMVFPTDMTLIYPPGVKLMDPVSILSKNAHSNIEDDDSSSSDYMGDIPTNPPGTPKELNPKFKRGLMEYDTIKKAKNGFEIETGCILPFQDGNPVMGKTDFLEFVEAHQKSEAWLAFQYLLSKISNLLKHYGVLYCEMNCDKLMRLAEKPLILKIRSHDLIKCMSNADRVSIMTQL